MKNANLLILYPWSMRDSVQSLMLVLQQAIGTTAAAVQVCLDPPDAPVFTGTTIEAYAADIVFIFLDNKDTDANEDLSGLLTEFLSSWSWIRRMRRNKFHCRGRGPPNFPISPFHQDAPPVYSA